MSLSEEGEIIDWIFSDGSVNGGNPNGNVSRDFSIQKDSTILVEESSWGRNNISYGLKATFQIAQNAGEDDGFYDDGTFELKSLCIDY